MHITKHYSKSSSEKMCKSVLLRESYREKGKVKNRTLANLKNLPDHLIDAIENALKRNDEATALVSAQVPGLQITQGKYVAQKLGIQDALGTSFEGKLALWQVMAQVIYSSCFKNRASKVEESNEYYVQLGKGKGMGKSLWASKMSCKKSAMSVYLF